MLLFVRSRFACNENARCDLHIVENNPPGLLMGDNTIVCALLRCEFGDLTNAIFGGGQAPAWIEYMEVLECGWDIASAPQRVVPIAADEETEDDEMFDADEADEEEELVVYEDDIEEDDCETEFSWSDYSQLKQPRPSWHIENVLRYRPQNERPSFGRKMLLCRFLEQTDERRTRQFITRLRSQLGFNCRPVWHGRSFEAYCFVDNSRASAILGRLTGFLDNELIHDFLLVQPMEVMVPDDSGISPLSDWVSFEYRVTKRRAHGAKS